MTICAGFIGLGNIGGPMAANLLDGDFDVCVYDVFPEAMENHVKKGAKGAGSIADIAASCDVIGVCVRDDNDVENLLFGAEGLLENGKADQIIAIHSTVTQSNIVKWAEDAKQKGIHLIDAPITGGADGAKNKKLCYMVGGDEALLERCRPVFETSAEKVIHAGAIGTGIAMKLCNNLMTYAAFIAVDEGSRLAESCGLDKEKLYEVGEVNGVVTPQMKQFVTGRDAFKGQIPDEDFEKIFLPVALLGEKDLDAALASAKSNNTSIPCAEFQRQVIRKVFLKEVE